MKNNLFFLVFLALSCLFLSCNKKGGELTLYPVQVGDEYQYIDKDGKIIINPQFGEASVFRNGIALVRTTGDKPKWGFIDETGHYIVNAQYKYATIFSEGLAWVVNEDGSPSAINEKGEIKFTLQVAEEVRIFSNGLASYRTVSKDGKNKWGFVDKEGTVVINSQFDNVGFFSDGKCAVSNEAGKWGYIDNSGKIIINYQFSSANIFSSGSAIVATNEKFGAIDKNGKYIINPQFNGMWKDGEWFVILQDGKYGWCNASGKIIINPQFKNVSFFMGKDVAPAQTGDKWGYVDKEGKININPQFDASFPFNGGLGLVSSSGKFGFIDLKGAFVINPQFDDISRDLIYYLTGGTVYSTVETDYFNVEAVTNALNLEKPEGLSLDATFGSILKAFSLQESSFSEYSNQHSIYMYKEITSDVTCNFYVYGQAYNFVTVTRNNGWGDYETQENQFGSNNKVTAYIFEIRLSNKGQGKAKNLVSAFVDKLAGFKKGKFTEGGIMYFNKTAKIHFTGSSSFVGVTILKPDGTETVDSDSKIIWEEGNGTSEVSYPVAVDSSVVAY